MRDRTSSITCLCAIAVMALVSGFVHGIAHADVFGRLHVTAHNGDDEKPIPNATIVLHDSTGVHADITLAALDGSVITPPLETHSWLVTAKADGYDDTSQLASVAPDTTINVDIDLNAKQEKVIQIHGNVNATNPSNPTVTNQITPAKLQAFPVAENPTSLPQALAMNPGFVESTVSAVHPRGEHASTTVNFNGVELPGALLGRAGQLFSPEVAQSIDAQTGGYAPEYGSEAAAILNVQLKSGPIEPYASMDFQRGSDSTFYSELTLAGQAGAELEKVESGPAPRRFRYFIDLSDRTTGDAVEPPNPGDQTAHNFGQSQTLFGNFDYTVDPKNTLSLFASDSPATTEIANRAGLPNRFTPYGQGYGYGGFRDANGNLAPTYDVNPGGLGDTNIVLPSQQADGQDIYQVDSNAFGYINLRHTFDSSTTGLLSVGDTRSGIQIKDNNSLPLDPTNLPIDSSEEFNPNVNRTSNQDQVVGSITRSLSSHTYKAGFVLDGQTGNETDQFTPDSQLAVDALASIDLNPNGSFAGRLTPPGYIETSGGKPVYDALGDPVYIVTGASSPVVNISHSGYYGAAYLQDTWHVTKKLTANYGVRIDTYHQAYSLTEADSSKDTSAAITSTVLSPRVNLSYALKPQTVLRASYNHLFTQPPLDQGAVLGDIAIQPETIDQYDVSVEREFAPRQTAKLAYYYKNIRNQDDTGILIPFTQIGAYTTINYQFAGVHGVELSYDLTPKNDVGLGAYVATAWSHAAPGGTSTDPFPQGFLAPTINDHNQSTTLSTGLDYTWVTKAQVGLDLEYGSGEASSALNSVYPPVSHTLVNFRALSCAKMLGIGSLQLDVENIFNSVSVLNYDSGFSGTRFSFGRMFLVSSRMTF